MGVIEALAIIILILAILILIYYFVLNNSSSFNGFNFNIPKINSEEEERPGSGVDSVDIEFEDDQDEDIKINKELDSMSKFKDMINDYDMSSFNTDAFSQKIDAFLDEKSDQLIEDWSLATQNDLDTLERRWASANESIEDLEKRFDEYSEFTNERLESLDKRIEALEEDKDN